jgi:PLP dependent protein
MEHYAAGAPAAIRARYEHLCERVEKAATKAGRSFGDIAIVIVTKKVDVQRIEEVIKAGARHLGENYLQEGRGKIAQLGRIVQWHFIGHLQKNKVNAVADLFDLIQSVDSLDVAERLEQLGEALGSPLKVLLQIHYGDESSKHGFLATEVMPFMERIGHFRSLKIRGLMTIPPLVEEAESNRAFFRDMVRLAGKLDKEGYENWENVHISMGMTDDYEIALQEGSTMIRVGRAIFGERA